MALTPTSAKGSVGLCLESANGLQLLLAATPVTSTITGITAPTGSTGMRFVLRLTNFTASGTLTITGVGTPNSTETVNIAALTAQQVQSAQLASFDYVSTNAYTAITNITTTGLTNGTITVWGVQAAKFNIPVTAFKSDRKTPLYSPNEFTGLMARDKRMISTQNATSISNMDSDFYGDLSLYWVYMLMGAPTWSTLPAAPTSLFAATALSSTQTLTTQPTAPGMKLIIAITAFTVAGTLTINGTSYGVATTETISVTAAGTYYSANVYSAVSSIANATTVATMAVTGVFAWKGIVTEEATRYTAAVEHFDGSASWTHPFVYATDGDMTISAKAECKLTMKGMAQDKMARGDRTTNPLQTSRVAAIGTPLNDLPVAGWQTQVYLDPITGTAQSTVFTDPDEEIKIVLATKVEPHYTFNNWQNYTRAYPIKPEMTCDLAYDIINLIQNEQFRQNLKQYLVVATLGRYVGTAAGTPYYEGWTWTLPGRYDGDYPQEADPSKGNVYAKPKWRTEYDAGIAGSYQLQVITQNPPTYPN